MFNNYNHLTELEKNQLIMDNTPFIMGIINKRFPNYKYKEDLFQVGSIGLQTAYMRFDENRECKFTSYAYPFILGEMYKYVREDKCLKVSRNIGTLNKKIERVTILLSQKLMRDPSISEISEILDVEEYMIVEAMKSNFTLKSIDEPINSDGKVVSLHEVIKDNNTMDLNSLIALKEELNSLTPFERSIIETRYMQDLTQCEAAKRLGISQVQVSRKEEKVLTKIRHNLVT